MSLRQKIHCVFLTVNDTLVTKDKASGVIAVIRINRLGDRDHPRPSHQRRVSGSKGSQVWLEGSLTLNEWTDKDGATHPSLEVRGSDIRFLSPAAVKTTATGTAAGTGEEEVPF